MKFQWRKAFEKVFHDSPAWSVSLGLHALILVVLLLVSVRVVSQEPLSLTLEFAPQPGPPGIPAVVLPTDVPTLADPEKMVQELAVSEKDVVQDPAAVPAKNQLVPNQDSAAARPAQAVGTLLTGRQEGRRRNLLAAGGGTDQTEQAVERALAWIVRQQTDRGVYAGLWSLRGPYPDEGQKKQGGSDCNGTARVARSR